MSVKLLRTAAKCSLFQGDVHSVGSPLASCFLAPDQWTCRGLSRRWLTTPSKLLDLRKVDLAAILVLGVLTKHCPIGIHAAIHSS